MSDKEPETKSSDLRKHVASFPVVVLFAISVAFSFKYFNTEFRPIPFLIVTALTTCSGLFPVRINANFVNNEFTLTDYPVVLGVFLLKPLHFAFAFMLGYSIVLIFHKYSLRRIFINNYCIFYGTLITALIIHSPIKIASPSFITLCILALIIFNSIDTLTFYFVCTYRARDVIEYTKSFEKLLSIIIGILLGVPSCIVIESHPTYSPILFIVFILTIVFINKYYEHLSRNKQLKLLLNFTNESSENNEIEESLLQTAKMAIFHNRIRLDYIGPNNHELGRVLYSNERGDHWLIVDKADFSKRRIIEDEMLLDEIAIAARNAFEHKALQEQLFKAARHDALTGLCNRGTLEEFVDKELGLVKRNKTEFSIMFIDLDKFKPINDTYGHKAGDEVLKCIARRLTLTVRTQDVVARIGGDEFVILCRDITIKDAKLLAGRISQEIKKPIYVDDQNNNEERIELDVGSSIGISSAPKDAITFENLLKTADQNMYKQKTKTHPTRALKNSDMPKKTRMA